MPILKILSTVPVFHSVQPEPFINFLTFSQQSGRAEMIGKYAVRWCVPGPHFKTVVARNIATNMALNGNADYLLLIDDDMIIPPDLLDRLLVHDVDIVSPLFFSTSPIEPLVYDVDELGDPVPLYNYPRNALFEAPGGCGTGVMLIRASVLRSMNIPVWVGSVDPTYGEDIEFCKRARKLGFRSWCDSSIKCRQMSLPVSIGEDEYLSGILTQNDIINKG